MNRIRQFFSYVVANMNSEDKKYVKKYLNVAEITLFNKLSIHEQKHSVNVARDVEEECKLNFIDSNDLIKAALLHDIGKIKVHTNLIDKSIIVILDKITKGKIKKFSSIKSIYIYYNHGYIGYCLIKELENDEVLFLVKNHDNKIGNDLKLNILQKCDDKN
ncbi:MULTISPECIES: HD domain-containing protein [Clostridium]|uniref:HD domain-containing protein n=1 Tax=Clostridium TaxID=1485 RepID=UPI000AD9DC99